MKTTKHFFALIAMLLCSASIFAEDWTEGQVVVNVESVGELRMAVLELDYEEILRLKICGPLNSVDLQYLSEGAGMISQLESIDLSDVTLVYDGGCYRDITMADSDVMFSKDRYKFYLTEETSEKHGVSLGLSSTKTHSYYGPDLAGVFMGKSYKHIVMPRGINRAAVYAFTSCANLQSVEFPDELKYVAADAFHGCKTLPTINLEQVDSIGKNAFYGCIVFNAEKMDKVKRIDYKAFYNCSNLNGINGVVSLPLCDSIAQYAFYGCTNIEKIEFSENLRFLDQYAFQECTSLASVKLPNSLKALLVGTFQDCTKLTGVSYSENLLKVHRGAFYDTPWYNNLPVEGGVKYMGHIAMYVVDPGSATAIREGTTSIADGFNGSNFSNNPSLPASLRRIGDSAFYGNKFTTLVMPEGLEQIGERAFYNSTQLTKITLNESLKEAGASAFSQCSQLNIVNYNPAELQAIGLFEDCTALEKVNVGAKVRKLPENIFDGCSNLAMIKFAERTDDTPFEVGAGAFHGCSYLSSLELPSATTEIGKGAFYGCGFRNFIVPEQVTVLNSSVFEECSSMSEIKLHGGIKIIGDRAFYRCYYLESIELPEGLDSIGEEAFYGCYPLKEITIPSTVTRIGSGAFKDCYMLQRINSRITHPMEVTGIVSLSDYIIHALYNTGMGTTACIPYRTKMYSEIILTVPAGSKKLYRQTAGWSNFANIAEEGDDMTEKNYLSPRIDRAIPASYKEYLNIYLTNDREDFTAYQFDLNIPYGIEVETDENGQYKYVMTDRNDVSHTIMVEKLDRTPITMDRNRYRFVCISGQNAAIKDTDGILLEIPLITDANMKPDSYEAKLENIIFTQQDGTENELFVSHFYINIAEVPDFTWGDANVDGAITVSDIVEVIDHILLRSRPGIFNEKAADANQDGEINISDVVKIVNLIMNE